MSLPLRNQMRSVYDSLGSDAASREAKLRTILDQFYARMASDAMLGHFFFKKDLPTIARRQGDFLLRAMGATESYSGKAPADAHLELPAIRRGFFDRRLVILREVLSAAGLEQSLIATWIAFEEAFRDPISS